MFSPIPYVSIINHVNTTARRNKLKSSSDYIKTNVDLYKKNIIVNNDSDLETQELGSIIFKTTNKQGEN